MRINPQAQSAEQLANLASLASLKARQSERAAKVSVTDVGRPQLQQTGDVVSLTNRADATLRLNVLSSQVQQSTVTNASVAQDRLGAIDQALTSFLSGASDSSSLVDALSKNGFELESTDRASVEVLRNDVRQGLVASSNIVDQRQRAIEVLGGITVESLGGADAIASRLAASINSSPQQAVAAHQLDSDRVRALLL
jgi:hypothetical protein